MPWRLVVFLLIMTVVIFFAGFNINNEADISFGFYTIEGVPIFISLFIAFLLGAFIMLPFTIFRKKSSQKKIDKEDRKEKKETKAKTKKQNKKNRKSKDDNIDFSLPEEPGEE